MAFKDSSTGIDFNKFLNMSPEEKEAARQKRAAERFEEEQKELARYAMGTKHLHKAKEWLPGALVEVSSPSEHGYVRVRYLEGGRGQESYEQLVGVWELHEVPPRKPVKF